MDRRIGHCQPCGSVIGTAEVEYIVSVGELIICKCKGGIAFDCLIQQADGFEQALCLRVNKDSLRDECLACMYRS